MTIRAFDQNPVTARLATFIRKLLRRLMDVKLLDDVNWSGISKGKIRKAMAERREGGKEMVGLIAFPTVVKLIKGIST